MKKTTYRRSVLGYPITAEITMLDVGVHILLAGGALTHIGAVSICGRDGLQTIEEKNHKESIISAGWAGRLYQAWNCPVTVSCGIHYDHISGKEIQIIVKETEHMLEEIIAESIQKKRK